MIRLAALLLVLTGLAACSADPPAHDRSPFYLAPAQTETQQSPPDFGRARDGTAPGLPGTGRTPASGTRPYGGEFSFGAGGGN